MPFLFSLLAKIWFRKDCFIIAFSVFLLCVLQFVCCCLCCLYSPPRFWSCVPLCCATSAVVCVTFAPPVRLYLVFLCGSSLFFWCSCAIFCIFLLCCLCGVEFSGFCCVVLWCCLVLWSVGCCSWLLRVCACFLFGLFGYVALSEILLLLLLLHVCFVLSLVCVVCLFGVCVLLLVLFCFGWSAVLLVGCRGCVALSAFLLLCVAPSWCWFMCFLLSWWFLVVVGPPPLFLVRHDLGWLCFLTQNATLVGWLCGVSAPGGLWEFVSVCFHVVLVVFELVDSVWCVSGSAFYSL